MAARKGWLVGLALVGPALGAGKASAQARYEEIVGRAQRPAIFAESIVAPSPDTSKVRLVIPIKVSYDYLTFVRSTDPADGSFIANA